MGYAYLVRYGLMRHVGSFLADSDHFERGEAVVVRSHRGTELGEILLKRSDGPDPAPSARVLRAASADDLARARQLDDDRPGRLAACERIFSDGVWPLELIDVEPLLDGRRTVLHYLGPHHLDVTGLLPIFRDACDLDVIFEPAGIDAADEPAPAADAEVGHGCGDCGSAGGCGSGGGCGSRTDPGSGGCSGCAIPSLMGRKRAKIATR